ncbi:hypothetical protein ACERK3_02280 [Phycisphaerales bacterium AB-hyl4]|uniref:Uncharacterized protein n=1 Tax=Natronomicrosphaera hydrolytica TaxID=3242702 RepID=A0ABV4U479_9BACT
MEGDTDRRQIGYRAGVLTGIDETRRHINAGATPEQMKRWRDEVERWTDARGWPSPVPSLTDVEGGGA